MSIAKFVINLYTVQMQTSLLFGIPPTLILHSLAARGTADVYRSSDRWQMRCDCLPGGEHYGLDFGDGMAPLLDLSSRHCGHKWLGCFLTTKNVQRPNLDVEHHLQSAARAWFVHKNIPLGLCLKFVNVVITPIACSAAGHRTLYPRDARRYDIEMRKMLRRMIPQPVGIDWSAPWHVIVRSWHARKDPVLH